MKKTIITLTTWIIYIIWLIFIKSTALSIGNFLSHTIILMMILFLNYHFLKESFLIFKNKENRWFNIIVYIIILIIILVIGKLLVRTISNNLNYTIKDNILLLLFKHSINGALWIFFTTVLFYPVIEELLFRKSLRLIIKNKILFFIISSLITWYFSLTLINPHLNELVFSIPIFFTSIYLAIIYIKTDNIWFTIIARMILNIITLIIMIF